MLVLTSETTLKCFCQEGLLVLTSETIFEYFSQEGFAHQSLKKFQLLKISTLNNSVNFPSFLLKINDKKEKQE